jgi:hypothetical protein
MASFIEIVNDDIDVTAVAGTQIGRPGNAVRPA